MKAGCRYLRTPEGLIARVVPHGRDAARRQGVPVRFAYPTTSDALDDWHRTRGIEPHSRDQRETTSLRDAQAHARGRHPAAA